MVDGGQSTVRSSTQATPFAEVNALLGDLLARIRAVLGEKLVGLYLYGSLVTGDFDPEISDIDLLAATTVDIDEGEAAALKRMHDDIAAEYEEWDNRIEVQYLALEGLKTFRTRTSRMGNISPGEPFHVIEAGKDWLMNWYVVREKGIALYGPPPEAIIKPILKGEFIQAVADHAHAWRTWIKDTKGSRPYQGYAILTACRALYAYRHGEQVSKKRAAQWVAKELPEWADLVVSALRWRLEARHVKVADPEATFPQAERFVHNVSDLTSDE
jgi:predicted nucleotidyltransferase